MSLILFFTIIAFIYKDIVFKDAMVVENTSSTLQFTNLKTETLAADRVQLLAANKSFVEELIPIFRA